MTVRKPLILTSGVVENLQPGDRLNGLWVFQGAWDNSTAYVENDVVEHDGSAYVCIDAHTNEEPPNGSYWGVLVAKGDPAEALPEFGGRLSLQSGIPTPNNASNESTLYYTPLHHKFVYLRIGGVWQRKVFDEISTTLPDPGASALPYDVYLYDNSGTVAMELVAWADDQTRLVSLSRDSETGLFIKPGDPSRVYVGSVYVNADGETSDADDRRHLYNWFNQVQRRLRYDASAINGGADWAAINQTTWRVANGSATPHISIFSGGPEHTPNVIQLLVKVRCVNSAAGQGEVGISQDGATTPPYRGINSTMTEQEVQAIDQPVTPLFGLSTFDWIEKGSASNTVTFRDDAAAMLGFCMA